MASLLLPLLAASNITNVTTTETDTEQQYGYDPSEGVAIVFIVLFGLSTLLHGAQATYFRTWFLLPTAVLCGLGESLGWVGRLWSDIGQCGHGIQNPVRWAAILGFNSGKLTSGTHQTRISATIISPTPLLAASFIIFSRIIQQLGPQYSLLPSRSYAWIFVSCDLIALVVQGVGGGLASAAVTLSAANQGADIMLGGIGFQFAVVVIFTFLVTDFLIRRARDAPWRPAEPTSTIVPGTRMSQRTRITLYALAFSNTVLFIRSVYRLIELSGGWEGRIIHTQVYFNVLDGGMIVLAMAVWNFVHPGVFLRAPAKGEDVGMEKLQRRAVEDGQA
ncbi:hypothetical protein HMN09_01182900 [Mycena chlorophos]|uniref:RTA1-domain-containing protein n=1 Tax=Mycena chlorophos TaxID=658473 RepID=A0A8H6VXK0_MYCCL|nr:hypothetical protein HMN09_01182900 [Mycena chlorophos]